VVLVHDSGSNEHEKIIIYFILTFYTIFYFKSY